MANTTKMTETDALANCIATALENGGSQWGKDQAAASLKQLRVLEKSGRVDDPTFEAVFGRLGNHSQTRQHLEKHNLLKTQPDALATAIREAIKVREAELKKI